MKAPKHKILEKSNLKEVTRETGLFGEFQCALLVGAARNASRTVRRDVLRILDAFTPFVPTLAFVVESDSSDSTESELLKLSLMDDRVNYISLGNLEEKIPDRLERLKHCRNNYIEAIRNDEKYSSCDLIIVADLDGINTKISEIEVQKVAESNLKWDILAANQKGLYYDILALRHKYWSPNNFIQEMEWLTLFLGKKRAWQHSLRDRMIRIPIDAAPIEVDSAFGGLCLYRRWVFEQFDYSIDSPEANHETDHVTLNRKAKSKGASIYIYPQFVNANWTVHSIDLIPLIRIIRYVMHIFPMSYFMPLMRKIKTWIGTRSEG